MKLCYRGVTYESNPPQVKTIVNGETAKFRGNDYIVHKIVMEETLNEQSPIVYRGVSEGTEKQTLRFLGQKYNFASVFFKPIITTKNQGEQTLRFLGRKYSLAPKVIVSSYDG